ncbi:MAG: hypothetical protein JST01_05880, partial [Cyanobacteria bacterium SZAS TMP-1]|nr:hypothetical protein [Cyanobacteria bacterium SZAS TMP-1]
MFQVQDKTEEVRVQGNNRSLWLIVRFLALWIGSLVLLTIIGLTVDINWTRPRVEAALGETLHRKIKLGPMRWHLGLNGLMIMTRSLKIDEMDGEPFLKSGGSNIALAFMPLLAGKIIVKHLQIDHPEIYAVKLKPGGWNFEDLLDPKTTINFMQIDSGVVHILDATSEVVTKESMDLTDVNFKFNWPRKGKHLPLFASCTVTEKGVELKLDKTVKAVLQKEPEKKVAASEGQSLPEKVRAIQNVQVAHAKAEATAFEPKSPVAPAVASRAAASPKPPATVKIDGLSTTKDANLLDTDYDLNCTVSDMPTAALARLMTIVSDGEKIKRSFVPNDKLGTVKGTLQLKAKIKGSMTRGFAADVKADLNDVELRGPDIGLVKTKSVTGAGGINMSKDLIAWDNILFKLGGLELKTRGDLKNWQTQASTYSVDMSAKPVNLATVSSALEFKSAGEEEDKVIQIFKTISLSGKAFFDLKLSGDRDQAKLITQLEAEGLPVSKLVEDIAPELAPLLVVSGVSRNAIVKGHFNSSGGRRVSIQNGTITIPDSTIKLDGEVDLLRDSIDIKFGLEDFPLKKAWENALKDEGTRKKITDTLVDTNPHNIVVAGFIHADGNIVRNRKGTTVSIVSKVHDGAISYNDNTLDTTGIKGTVVFKNDIASIENFTGSIGHGGHFNLSGKVLGLLTKAPFCQIDFAGTGVNFAHLGSVMNVFKLSFPAITEGHLTGTVKSLIIKIAGSHEHPKVYFNAAPQDVSYQPPGLTRSLKAVSGNIIYDDDKISLNNVGIVSHGNRLTTNLSIYNLRTKARLSDIHVKSDGIELGDIDYYLSSSVMPAALRKSYRDLLNSYKIKKLHGKIYGDLVVVPKPNNDLADLEGVIGCYSVGATVSKLNLPLERMAGTFAASGNELLIQDLSGYIRSTQFEMNGWV